MICECYENYLVPVMNCPDCVECDEECLYKRKNFERDKKEIIEDLTRNILVVKEACIICGFNFEEILNNV